MQVEEKEKPPEKAISKKNNPIVQTSQQNMLNVKNAQIRAQEKSIKKDLFDGKDPGATPPPNIKS